MIQYLVARQRAVLSIWLNHPNRERLTRLAALSAARATIILFSFGSVAIIARSLSPAEVGAWSILLAAQGYALQISECGLRTIVTAEAGRPGQTPQALLWAYLSARLSIAFAVYAAICLSVFLLKPAWTLPVALQMISLFAIALFLDWICLVEDRTTRASLLLVLRPATFLAGILIAGGDLTIERLAGLFALSWTVAAAVSWPLSLARRTTVLATKSLNAAKLIKLGRPVMLSQLIGQAMVNLDLLAVGAVLGLALAGQYFLAASMATACLVIANAAGQIANARLGAVTDTQAFDAEITTESRLLAWIATLFVAVMAPLSGEIVRLFFGAGYAHAGQLFVVMLPWIWMAHQTALLQAALVVRRQQALLLRISTNAMIVMLAGLAASSLTGAALGFAAARCVTELARLYLLLRQLHPTSRKAILSNLIPPATISILLCLVAT